LDVNLGSHVGKPATKRLSYGTAYMERLTVMVTQCLLLPNFEVVIRAGISEVMSQKFRDNSN
jgi:hypothetical protein